MTTPVEATPTPEAAVAAAAAAASPAPPGSITLWYVELCKFRRLGKVQLDLDRQTRILVGAKEAYLPYDSRRDLKSSPKPKRNIK